MGWLCEEVCFGRRYLFADSKPAGKESHADKPFLVVHRQVIKEVTGARFRAVDLEMQILFPLENPADSDKGAKYKIGQK